MAKISQEQIQQMVVLYDELKNYSAVARTLGVSASTVSKYVKEYQNIRTYNECVEPKPVESIPVEQIISFSDLTDEEQKSYKAWLKEFNR